MARRREDLPEQAEDWVVQVVSCVLCKLIDANAGLQQSGLVTKFHALRPPNIGIVDYMERIQRYSSASGVAFVFALIYIDRLIRSTGFTLTLLNAHRVIITSIMVAAKFFDDQYYNNAFYAKVGGVPGEELNTLEIEFLFRVNFILHVTVEEYANYKQQLYRHAASGLCTCRVAIPYHVAIAQLSPVILGYRGGSESTSGSCFTRPSLNHPESGNSSSSIGRMVQTSALQCSPARPVQHGQQQHHQQHHQQQQQQQQQQHQQEQHQQQQQQQQRRQPRPEDYGAPYHQQAQSGGWWPQQPAAGPPVQYHHLAKEAVAAAGGASSYSEPVCRGASYGHNGSSYYAALPVPGYPPNGGGGGGGGCGGGGCGGGGCRYSDGSGAVRSEPPSSHAPLRQAKLEDRSTVY